MVLYNKKIALTERLLKRLKTQCDLDQCERCRRKFVVGDTAVSHKCPQLNTHRYYCVSCWDGMYI